MQQLFAHLLGCVISSRIWRHIQLRNTVRSTSTGLAPHARNGSQICSGRHQTTSLPGLSKRPAKMENRYRNLESKRRQRSENKTSAHVDFPTPVVHDLPVSAVDLESLAQARDDHSAHTHGVPATTTSRNIGAEKENQLYNAAISTPCNDAARIWMTRYCRR